MASLQVFFFLLVAFGKPTTEKTNVLIKARQIGFVQAGRSVVEELD